MKLAFSRNEVDQQRNSVVTVGAFDGVHRGHQEILREVVGRARARNGRSVVVTFDPHPREVVGTTKGPVPLLTTPEERRELIAGSGVELLVTLPFNDEFSRLSSREFFEEYLVNGTGVSELVEGYDHHFGRNREGNAEALLKLGMEFGFTFHAVQAVRVGDVPVSSSRIRAFVAEGNVESAEQMLGRPYHVAGTVVEGDKRGRGLGFPTANILPSSEKKLQPANGIYLVQAEVAGEKHYGLASVGVRPTFHTAGKRTMEVFLFDFDRTIYGEHLALQFLRRLRDELKFDSAEELVRQMEDDRKHGERLLKDLGR